MYPVWETHLVHGTPVPYNACYMVPCISFRSVNNFYLPKTALKPRLNEKIAHVLVKSLYYNSLVLILLEMSLKNDLHYSFR